MGNTRLEYEELIERLSSMLLNMDLSGEPLPPIPVQVVQPTGVYNSKDVFDRPSSLYQEKLNREYEALLEELSNILLDGSRIRRDAGFKGSAFLDTNPFSGGVNSMPGVYFATTAGLYTVFDVNVQQVDLVDSIVLLIPLFDGDNLFKSYTKQVHRLKTSSSSFVYTSDIERADWIIQHNLGRIPSVVIHDSMGTTYMGSIKHLDENTTVISFSAPFNGTAVLN